MPRPSKGARLVWREESRKPDGSLRSSEGWYIEDRGKRHSTGCGRSELGTAEKRLAEYIASKHTPTRPGGKRDPSEVTVDDVINAYAVEVAPSHANPAETAARLGVVLAFFSGTTLAEINGSMCRLFVENSSSPAAARRQLEDLRAAINHYHREGHVTAAPAIVMPPKSASRERWLTREEAARLLRAAWRMRQTWKGRPSDRRTGQHVARFILVGLYTGTRSGAICGPPA